MISKIKWKNHSVLGNLEMDFTDENKKPYNTIILAGENGTGKTTILETICKFLNLDSITPFDYIQYTVGEDNYKVFYEENDNHGLGFHKRYSFKTGETKRVSSNKNNNVQLIGNDYEDIRHYGVSYSKARSGFKTNVIKSSTTEQIDASKYNNDEKDDFTSIKQLLVDLSSQDNAEWMSITKNGDGTSFEEFRKNAKLFRFEHAFNEFFDRLKFKEIDETNASEKKIVFEKGSKDISVDELSTGEKQIVFRGTQLLRNINSVRDGVVLIDEPELSMHPRWQEKILDYYRNLFLKDSHQVAQLIFATHSEYVIKRALQNRANVLIVVLKEENGEIIPEKITALSVLPSITAAETNYLAFNIVSVDYHIQLYGYLQSITQNTRIKDCDTYIKNHPSYDVNKHSKVSGFNSTQYDTLCTYIRNAIDHPDSGNMFTKDELKTSTELLIEMCKNP
jgi:predicted ATP-binding protein involved in virulence